MLVCLLSLATSCLTRGVCLVQTSQKENKQENGFTT